jgi:hypothetical protein
MSERSGRDAWLRGIVDELAEEGTVTLDQVDGTEILDVVYAAIRVVMEGGDDAREHLLRMVQNLGDP